VKQEDYHTAHLKQTLHMSTTDNYQTMTDNADLFECNAKITISCTNVFLCKV